MDPDVHRAADVLRSGGVVAFPTETVYGLGADASNERAVRRLFEIKGRPADHPLIVHLGGASQLGDWASTVPEAARRLAQRFWPGPLTIILRKAPGVLAVVTGGQDTVGLRVPSHPVAQALLEAFGGGVAAPSANRFGRVSPTTAEHVRRDLGPDVDVVLDGGPCHVGVESTIVDLSGATPAVLRPGGIPVEDLEEVLGVRPGGKGASDVRAPGALESHYAPRARVEALPAERVGARAAELASAGTRAAVLSADDVRPERLYASLRREDEAGAEVILAPLPEDRGLGAAVRDRLRKAAGPR